MKILWNPFIKCVSEIKNNWNLSKKNISKYNKSKVLMLAWSNVLLLIIYSISWIAAIGYIILGIFLDLRAFLALIAPMPLIVAAIFIQSKVYPEFKKNYLRSLNKS